MPYSDASLFLTMPSRVKKQSSLPSSIAGVATNKTLSSLSALAILEMGSPFDFHLSSPSESTLNTTASPLRVKPMRFAELSHLSTCFTKSADEQLTTLFDASR